MSFGNPPSLFSAKFFTEQMSQQQQILPEVNCKEGFVAEVVRQPEADLDTEYLGEV